jgi:L-asparaginase II
MSGLDDLTRRPRGRDGCGIPAPTLPLGNLALAMARFGRPDDQPEARQRACARLRAAMTARPDMAGGTGRVATDVMRRLAPRVLVKDGAEGVIAASLPEEGLGLAVKVADGAGRAAPVVLGALLGKLEYLSAADAEALASHLTPDIRDRRGNPAGAIRPSAAVF